MRKSSRNPIRKSIALMASLALVVGLVPLPAFAGGVGEGDEALDHRDALGIGSRANVIEVADDQRGTYGENLTWTLTGEGNNLTLTISGTGAISNYDWYTTQGASPWSGNGSITSVVIEEGVTSVGNYSFDSCTSLANVSIPSSVTGIGIRAFNNCSALKGIDIPASVTNIGTGAFGSSGLTSVDIPASVATVGAQAFDGCSSLRSVVFQGAVGSIGDCAFFECTSLESVVFQGAVGSMDDAAFDGCSSWKDVYCYGTSDQFGSFDRIQWGTGFSGKKPTAHYTQHAVTASSSDESHGSSKIEWTWDDAMSLLTSSATLTATPAEGYHFASWTKGGTVVSTDNPYRFYAGSDAEYVANFEPNSATYTISAAADPAVGGTVSGGGTFTYGQEATLTAEAGEGYVFDYWSTKDAPNTSLSKSASFKVGVAGTQEYVAHFRQILIRGKDSERIPDQAYTGDSATPEVRVYLDGVDEALIEKANYTVDYSDNVNAGTAKITVTLTDPWKGTGVATFGITQADLSSATVTVADQVYDGTAQKPVPTVTWNGKQVAQDDYTAAYANNVRAGTATVTLTGKRNFTETSKASGTFKIAKRPVTVTADSAERAYDGAPLTASGFTSEGLAEGDMVESAKVEGSQTDVGSSANKVSGAKIVNAAGEDVTDCYDIAYKDGTLTVKPAGKTTPMPKMTSKGRTALSVAWAQVYGAAGYDVFFSRCNHDGEKVNLGMVATVGADGSLSWDKGGLMPGTSYKVRVKAYVMENGEKRYISTSPLMHLYTEGGKYTNAKAVKLSRKKVTLKKGGAFKLRATVKKVNGKKKLMPNSHVPRVRYMCTDKKVATVTSGGKIKARKAGACYVYAYAHNGVAKRVKVTVK